MVVRHRPQRSVPACSTLSRGALCRSPPRDKSQQQHVAHLPLPAGAGPTRVGCCFHRHCISEGGGFTGEPDYPQGGCNSTTPNSSSALPVSFIQGGEALPFQLRPRMAVRRRRVYLSNWAEGSSLSRMVSVPTNHRVWLPPKPSCAGYPTPTYRTYFPRN